MPILTDQERIGTTLAGKYRLQRILGKGGMGTVFGAVHAWTDREVAVKLLKADFATDPGVVQRFLQEAKAAASLKHPNVVDVLDMGHSEDGGVYLVLEYLRGEPLGNRIERGPMPPGEALATMLPVIEALAVAHSRGIVHRDLKPDNIYLAIDGRGQLTPKLLDFGIAKVMGSSSKTGTGHIVGTPLYMSPEQVRGQSDLGAASDVWSMGVVLFECLTGQVPFNASTPTGVLMAIVTTSAPSVASMGVHVPAEVAAVVDRALVADLHVRYRDAKELGEALHAAGLAIPASQRTAPVVSAVTLGETHIATTTGDSAVSRPSAATPVAWTATGASPLATGSGAEPPRAKLPAWIIGAVVLLGVSAAAGLGGVLLGSVSAGGSDSRSNGDVPASTPDAERSTSSGVASTGVPLTGLPTTSAAPRAVDIAPLDPDAGSVVAETVAETPPTNAPDSAESGAGVANVRPGRAPRGARPAVVQSTTAHPAARQHAAAARRKQRAPWPASTADRRQWLADH